MTLVIADIDCFEQVNDVHGHLVGDDVIRIVSRLMAEHLGRVGRLGGEEFAFLSSDVPMPMLMRRLNAFRASVESVSIALAGGPVSVMVSGGLAIRQVGQSFEALYAAADRALYAARTLGRNRILVATAGEILEIDPPPESAVPIRQAA